MAFLSVRRCVDATFVCASSMYRFEASVPAVIGVPRRLFNRLAACPPPAACSKDSHMRLIDDCLVAEHYLVRYESTRRRKKDAPTVTLIGNTSRRTFETGEICNRKITRRAVQTKKWRKTRKWRERREKKHNVCQTRSIVPVPEERETEEEEMENRHRPARSPRVALENKAVQGGNKTGTVKAGCDPNIKGSHYSGTLSPSKCAGVGHKQLV